MAPTRDVADARREPLYRKLKDALERRILNGEFSDGRRLPSSRALASDLGISRNTVVMAYQDLIAEGLVASRPRSGLIVNAEMQAVLRDHRSPSHTSDGESRPNWDAMVRKPTTVFRHIVKPSDWYAYPYPFIYGQPSSETFPSQAWLRALRDALNYPHFRYSLQDSGDQDDPLLVERLCNEILPSRGIQAHPDEVLITAGSQHGLYLVAESVVNSQYVVGMENPGYPDAAQIFANAGACIRPIDIDVDGLLVSHVPETVDLLYATPSHQFPTSVTLSAARRHRLLDLARSDNVILIEDDYDSEFRYAGMPVPALKAEDVSGRVIYLGSFSKFLAPGLRLGYVVGDKELIEPLRYRRRYMVRHPPGHLQRALALMVASGDYQRSVRRTRRVLRDRCQALAIALAKYMPWSVSIPTGGSAVWVEGPADLDARTVARQAAALGILIEPGDMFFLSEPPKRNCFRLGFGAISKGRIDLGIRLLAGVIQKKNEHYSEES